MASADRQLIMETNRSIRNIKTELENLLEKGIIDESVFETIHATLPAESPLSGPLRKANSSTTPANPTPASTTGPTHAPPTEAFNRLDVGGTHSPAPSRSPGPSGPPSYDETPAPNMPPRRNEKPSIARARALYRYAGAEARDLYFERDDQISVHSYMNDDWWMGQNLRTGNEGIFPRNYVLVESENKQGPIAPNQAWPQQPTYGYPAAGQQYAGPPAQQNPYNAHVPPVAVAEGGQPADGHGDNKVGQYGKKFGKKLGNAAIFGAGATVGSNIVNSIF